MLEPQTLYSHSFMSVSGAQLQPSVGRPCPGENVTFTCTIRSYRHEWDIPSLNITRKIMLNILGRVIIDQPPFQFTTTNDWMIWSITSTATVTATVDLNGTLIVCRDAVGQETEQQDTIKLIGKFCVCFFFFFFFRLGEPSEYFTGSTCKTTS